MQAFASAFREAASALLRHRLRSSLSALGIVIGVGALSAVLAVGDGLERFARGQILETTSIQSVVLSPRSHRILEGHRVPVRPERRLALSSGEFDQLVASLPPLHRARLEQRSSGEIVRAGRDPLTVILRGVSTPVLATQPTDAAPLRLHGRDLDERDLRETRAVALVDTATARRLGFAPAEVVGRTIAMEGESLEIVGCLEVEGAVVVVPVELVCRIDLDPHDHPLPSALLEAVRLEDVDRVEAALREHLAARDPEWEEGAQIVTRRDYLEQMKRGMLLFKLFMGTITGISLLVGGIGIMNVLLVSVTERTREIGLRRSLGARRRDIQRQLLVESVLLCGFGSLTGVALGVAMAFLATWVMRVLSESEIHAAVTLGSLAFAVGIAAVVGIGFGMYPARKAARLTPVEALRHE